MKKNNKGFFLAETLIVISLVTLILAFVYPNLSKLYETFVLKTNYYDQVQDIQALKSIDFVFNSNINSMCYKKEGGEYINKLGESQLEDLKGVISYNRIGNMNLEELYIADYDTKATGGGDYGLARYLKRIRKNKLSPTSCRLIGKFKSSDDYDEETGEYVGEYRYASVEHGIAEVADDGKVILRYSDNLTGIKPILPDSTEEEIEYIVKNDEKLYMIIGDDRVYRMLTSIRNINDGFYCNYDGSKAASYKVNTVDTLPNNCSFYYFVPGEGVSYKTHVFSTINHSLTTIAEQMDAIKTLLEKYENDTAIKKDNINIMFVYGTNNVLNSSESDSLDIIKEKLIDTGVLEGINYKISTIPPINISSYNSCKGTSVSSNYMSYNTTILSKYSGKTYDLTYPSEGTTFTPEYESCENDKVSGYDYKDSSNINLLELYLNELKKGE